MAETASTDSTIDADTSSDADIAAALGIEEAEQEGSADQESEEQDEVGAEVKRLRIELATLRRENAERRVKDRQRQTQAKSEAEGSTDIAAAREAGREEARAENGIELTTEAVRAALTGIIPDDDLDEFVDELNISRFVTDDHRPDRDAIAGLKARQSKLVGARKTAKVNHGRSGNGQSSKSVQQQFEDTMAGLLNG